MRIINLGVLNSVRFNDWTQYAKMKFSTKSKARNKTYPALISILQGFQKYIA